jgi:hypothetical protein
MAGLRRVRWWGRHNDNSAGRPHDGFATRMNRKGWFSGNQLMLILIDRMQER